MDGQRFDALAKAMASGATRRGALRLAGGGLAGAVLAAAGLGRRAEAQEQDRRPCDEVLAACLAQVGGACDHLRAGSIPKFACLAEHGGACTAYFEACTTNCVANDEPGDDPFDFDRKACAGGCPAHEFCGATLNPEGRLVCRCLSL